MKTAIKTTVNIPEWAEYFNSYGEASSETSAYRMVPLIYRCVRLVSDSLASVPLKCYRGKGERRTEVEWPWPELDAAEWTRRTMASLLIWGAGYSVILGNQFRGGMGLQWVNPSTITPQSNAVDDYGNPVLYFQQTPNTAGGKSAVWTQEQMYYVREFNPVDDVLPGPGAVKVALTDAGLIRYLTKFASYYFEKGAMPLTILSVDKNVANDEVKRVEGVFRQIAQGFSKAWSVVALRGGKDSAPFTLTPPLKDLVMPELHEQARRAVAAAFGIPQTMLEDAANYATATEHTMQFWQTNIRPRGKQIAGALTAQVGRKLGLEFEYAFEEMDIFQEDEAKRAVSLGQLTTAGVPLLLAMDILGYDLDADQRAQLEKAEADKEAAAQALRENITRTDQTDQKPEGEPQPEPPDEQKADMKRWERKSIKSFEKGKGADVEFESEFIPLPVAAAIHARLADCQTVGEIHAAFEVKEEPPAVDVAALIVEMRRANDLLEKEAA